MQRLFAILAAAGVVTAAASARAQSGGPPQGDTVTVGIGLGVAPSFEGAGDYRLIPGGILRGTVRGHDFQFNGPQLFIDAVPNSPHRRIDVELGPMAGLGLNRTGRVNDRRVAALGKLSTAVELGLQGSLGLRGVFNRTDRLGVTVTALRDVAGAHRSHVIRPSVEYSALAGSRTFVSLAFAGEFVGRSYAVYNFGIDSAGSAASGLAAYTPRGGLASLGGNVLAAHSLSGGRKGWSLFAITSYRRLRASVAASPIVRDAGSPNQFFAASGLGYTF